MTGYQVKLSLIPKLKEFASNTYLGAWFDHLCLGISLNC